MGMIKYLVVTLAHISAKTTVMDVVVDCVPTRNGMLLLRNWDKNMGFTMKMEMKYAIVPLFAGELGNCTKRPYFPT